MTIQPPARKSERALDQAQDDWDVAMTQGLTIRLAKYSDAQGISALIYSQLHHRTPTPAGPAPPGFLAGFASETINGYIGSVRYRYWVALMEGQLVGALGIRDSQRIVHLFVGESYQRRGIARALWSRAKSELLAGGDNISIVTNSSIHAIPMYERFGFKTVGPRVERAGVSCVPMRLVIGNGEC